MHVWHSIMSHMRTGMRRSRRGVARLRKRAIRSRPRVHPGASASGGWLVGARAVKGRKDGSLGKGRSWRARTNRDAGNASYMRARQGRHKVRACMLWRVLEAASMDQAWQPRFAAKAWRKSNARQHANVGRATLDAALASLLQLRELWQVHGPPYSHDARRHALCPTCPPPWQACFTQRELWQVHGLPYMQP